MFITLHFQQILIYRNLFSNVRISCAVFRHLSVVYDSLSSLSCCFLVVKHFFQTFFNSNLCFLYLSEATVISYNIFRRLSTCFFIIFWVVLILTFFRIVCSFSTTHQLTWTSITELKSFVKGVFKFFHPHYLVYLICIPMWFLFIYCLLHLVSLKYISNVLP